MDKQKQGQLENELRLQRKAKMIRMFLSGILCGVIMAAALTYIVAIPANNDHWRMEIVKRGGGTWYFEKNGRIAWKWTVPVVPEHGPRRMIAVPKSQPPSATSHEDL